MADPSGIARRFLVSGTVQGVGFRYFTLRAANRLGLSGWVRNLPDGRVEALAVGDERGMAQFEAELRRGPAGGEVTNLHMEEILVETHLSAGFAIR